LNKEVLAVSIEANPVFDLGLDARNIDPRKKRNLSHVDRRVWHSVAPKTDFRGSLHSIQHLPR